jgi:hypothetical protein
MLDFGSSSLEVRSRRHADARDTSATGDSGGQRTSERPRGALRL